MIVVGSIVLLLGLAHLLDPAGRHRPPVGVDSQPPASSRDTSSGSSQSPGRVLIGLVRDHALGEQAGERLGEVEIAAFLQAPG